MNHKVFKKNLCKILNKLREEKYAFFSRLAQKKSKNTLVLVNSIYIPEELICALGAVPVHLSENSKLDNDLGANLLVYTKTDECKEEVIEKYKNQIPNDCTFYLEHPNENSLEEYKKSIQDLMQFLEKNLKKKYNEGNIAKAIRTCNETRYILSQISEIHRINSDLIDSRSWQELLSMSWILPRDKFNKRAKRLLQSLKHVPKSNNDISIIVCGSSNNHSEVKEIVESCGGNISCDTEAMNYPRFNKVVTQKTPLLEAIIEGYFYQYPSVFFTKASNRIEKIKELVDKFQARGVIYQIPDANNNIYQSEIHLLKQLGVATLELNVNILNNNVRDKIEQFISLHKAA